MILRDAAAFPEFIGYYTVAGPIGYVEADSADKVKNTAQALREEFPNVKTGHMRYSWRSKKYWARVTPA